jgi:hypothetical protein
MSQFVSEGVPVFFIKLAVLRFIHVDRGNVPAEKSVEAVILV